MSLVFAPGLGELAERAEKLATTTEDASVTKLADAITRAERLKGGRDTVEDKGEGEMD